MKRTIRIVAMHHCLRAFVYMRLRPLILKGKVSTAVPEISSLGLKIAVKWGMPPFLYGKVYWAEPKTSQSTLKIAVKEQLIQDVSE